MPLSDVYESCLLGKLHPVPIRCQWILPGELIFSWTSPSTKHRGQLGDRFSPSCGLSTFKAHLTTLRYDLHTQNPGLPGFQGPLAQAALRLPRSFDRSRRSV